MTAPTNKVDFYDGWKKNKFGNRLRTAEELPKQYTGKLSMRYTQAGSKFSLNQVNGCDLSETYHQLIKLGANKDSMVWSESPDDSRLLMQGEIASTFFGWSLDFSLLKMAMRPALAEGRQRVTGSAALAVLRHYANDNSYDMIMDLFDTYDAPEDHRGVIVEFSCYNYHLGNMPGHNTIIWEIRRY